MKKIIAIVLLLLSGVASHAQQTIPVLPGDSHETIIAKAVKVVPSANQYEALRNEFIAFIHFGPNSFTRMEWGNGMEDPKIFDLKELHTDQWCAALKAAGMKMVIITVKHHDGFVLWQSRYTRHGIMETPFKNGQGDILKELSASCKKFGLKLGIYLSPADLFQIESPTGLYGNGSKPSKRTIPTPVPGRPFSNPTRFEFEVDDYNAYFLNQLFELLTEYGPVHEVWFDGAHPKRKGGQTYNYLAWKELISKLAPKAVIFGKQDIRWCGNEAGMTRPTEWNVIPYAEDPARMNNFADLTDSSLGSRDDLYKGKFLHYQQAETNTSIREGWFYRDDTDQKVRSADDVFDIYERAVGGNSTFLLNIPPNRNGSFSPRDSSCLIEVGRRINATYGKNLFDKAAGPKQVLDKDNTSFVPVKVGSDGIIITTPLPVTINRLMIQEAITTQGERVEEHALDAWLNGQWKEIAHATNIGYKRILRFPTVTASKFRLRILAARATPAISTVSAHFYATRPPQLQITRNLPGMVQIEPMKQVFNWNTTNDNAAKNLNAGYQVYFTTNGHEPGLHSTKYTGPFKLDKGTVKAISVINSDKSAVSVQSFGLLKNSWTLLGTNSDGEEHAGKLAMDANANTYWQSASGAGPHFIAIDLGQEYTLKRFVYTPQNHHPEGMMASGTVQISADGKTWQLADRFEFGNLVNDPTARRYTFLQPITTRYIRIEATQIANGGKTLAIAELDFFED